jgi:hypothetical protein
MDKDASPLLGRSANGVSRDGRFHSFERPGRRPDVGAAVAPVGQSHVLEIAPVSARIGKLDFRGIATTPVKRGTQRHWLAGKRERPESLVD